MFPTPSGAIIGVTVATLVALLFGDAILVPITEVGSMASALGWLAACLSFWLVEGGSRSATPKVEVVAGAPPRDQSEPAAAGRRVPRITKRAVTAAGILVSLLLLLMKLVPAFPGHFTQAEWIALTIWLAIGAVLHRRPTSDPALTPPFISTTTT